MAIREQRPERSPLPVPRQAVALGFYGDFFTSADVPGLLAAAGCPTRNGVDTTALVSRLNAAALDLVVVCAATAGAAAGESAAWARQLEKRATALLACFVQADDGGDPVQQAERLLRGPSGYLEEIPYFPYSSLQALLAQTADLVRRAGAVAKEFENHKGSTRQAPAAERRLYEALASIYKEAFGREPGYSTNSNRIRGGPSIRFFGAFGAHLASRIDFSGGGELRTILLRLQDASGCAKQLQSLRKEKGK